MLIAVDIGNSSINIGYFTDKGLQVLKIKTNPLRKPPEYTAILNDFMLQNHIEKKDFSCIISSVVVGHTEVIAGALEGLSEGKSLEVMIVSHRMKSGLTFDVRAPEEMGADRIANAAGAYEIFKSPVAVIDFGTATTITVVDGRAACIGGSILPGLGLMNTMLAKGTSRLKEIGLEAPGTAIGKDTADCIRSGLFYGTAGAVERILAEIEKEAGCELKVVITGGFSIVLGKFVRRPHEFSPYLTLEGLKVLYEKNRNP